VVVDMIAVAEESNNLETVLVQIADTNETRTARSIELGVRVLEPILLVVMAMLVFCVAVALLLVERKKLRRGLAIGAPVLAIGLAFLVPRFDVALFNQGLYRDLYVGARLGEGATGKLTGNTGELIYHQEGINTAVAVFRAPGGATLHIGGKPDASTNPGDVQTQLLSSHLALLHARNPRTVAVLGYGSGMTAAGVLAHPGVERLDLMEIEQAVIDASPYFRSVNGNPLADRRTRLVLEDGRIHLAYTDTQYDVVISEPSNPWMAGISNLFTTDFYGLVRARLSPDGLFAQWIQNYDMTREIFGTIVASIHDAFPHLVVFQPNPWDTVVLASPQPIVRRWEDMKARFAAPTVRQSLIGVGIGNPLELGFFLLAPEAQAVDLARRSSRRNTDDNVWLEHRMPREMVRATSENVAADLLRQSAPARLGALEAMWPGVGVAALAQEMVWFPHRSEPVPLGAKYFSEPWREARLIQFGGLEGDLLARGRTDLARSVKQWDERAEAYRATRVRVAEELAGIVRSTGRLPDADTLGRMLKEAPDLPMVLSSLGTEREAAGDLAGAERFWKQVLEHPRSAAYYDALLGLGRIARARNDFDGARAFAERARDRNLYFGNAFAALAKLDIERGNRARARQYLEEGLRFNPREPALTELLADLR
jgi:spermidine synthase/tetratricopeptide (TPR) repeat protein